MTTALLLLAAHLVGDFPLQPTWMAKQKLDNPNVRLVHVVIHTILVGAFLTFGGVAKGVPAAFYVYYAATHYVIDCRRWGEPRDDFPAWQYVIDQVLHVTALALVSAWFL